jgi:cell division protease FtsH
MVRDFGMSPRLGPVGFSPQQPQYLGGQELTSRPFAEQTQRVIDEEVSRLLSEAEHRATQLLTDRREGLDTLIDLLLERESIDGEEVERVLGLPPRPSEDDRRRVQVAPARAASSAIGPREGSPAAGG